MDITKYKGILVVFLILLILEIVGHAQKNDFPVIKGPYIGQKPPGMVPEVFARGIVSTAQGEFNAAFSPDGKEFFYSVNEAGGQETMKFMMSENDRWKQTLFHIHTAKKR